MRRAGIGTDATRPDHIQTLYERCYAVKEKGRVKPTELGMRLIEFLEGVDESLVNPETRRRIEELARRAGETLSHLEHVLEGCRVYSELLERLLAASNI